MWHGQLNMLHPKLIELEKKFQPSVCTQLFSPLFEQKQIELWVKRDDLIHPIISGNKWRKLKYILNHALAIDCQTIVSMGGAYSNHLHALAFVGKQLKLKTVGYIRGEKPSVFSPTLQDMKNWGMELKFISRTDYRKLRQYKQFNQLPHIKKNTYWLPEGGATKLALQGIGELISEIDDHFDSVCTPCGTATTLAGLIQSIPAHCVAHGFSALKGGQFLTEDVKHLIPKNKSNWTIHLDYHFGGFAKKNKELLLFIDDFEKQHGIELESVYSGKMFYGLFDLIQQNYFKIGQRIIAIHTGGLQGNRSLTYQNHTQ